MVWYLLTIFKKPHPRIVLMPDAGIYLHGNQCVLDETHIRTAVLREMLYGLVGKGKGPLASWGGCLCPYPIVANVEYMQVGAGHYDLPLPPWLGVGFGPSLQALWQA